MRTKLAPTTPLRLDPNSVEYARQEEINHFMYKHKRWTNTPEEKVRIKRAIQRYPNRNGIPVPPNN